MIKGYSIVLLLVVVALIISAGYIIAKSRHKHDKIYLSIILLYIAALIACISNLVIVNCVTEMQAQIAYSAYFSSVDWMLIFMLMYATQYTKVWQANSATPWLASFIAILDNVSLFSNFKWGHGFILSLTKLNEKEAVYTFTPNDFYYVHLSFSYILVAIILIIFIKKVFFTGGFYKGRHFVILLAFVAILIIDGCFLLLNLPIDYSVCLYGVLAIFIGYFSLQHNSRAFIEYMLATVAEKMDCAIICFDENDVCMYANQLANRIYGTSGIQKLMDERFKKWKKGKSVQDIPNSNWSENKNVNGEELKFDVHFNKIYDKQGRYYGCYFSLYDVTSDYVAYEEEKYRSTHDSLTGALTRDAFYAEARRMLESYPNVDYVMVCGNIKGFKLINDMFGLEVADRLLIKVADTIRGEIQQGAVFSRLEADRFAVLMPKERYSEEIFRRGMRDVECFLEGSKYRMNIKVGVYDIYDRNASVTSMCDRAFMAIDSIKTKYKEDIAYYGDMLRKEYMNEQMIIAEFEDAIENEEIVMYLQPIVNKEGNLELAEGLARWVSEEKGVISPADFIPILEETGLIYKLDMHIWELAAKKLAKWKEKGREDLSISVNISVKDFYYIDIFDVFVGLVEKYNIRPEKLKLEITETVFMNEKDRQIEIINSLKDYGFLVEIDDFGSGYSSLNMLKEVPANILKIDMAFLQLNGNENKGKKIVSTIIALAKALDMQVVVEGVEQEEQVEFLIEAGCDLFQGFYFDRPLPVLEFEEKYL